MCVEDRKCRIEVLVQYVPMTYNLRIRVSNSGNQVNSSDIRSSSYIARPSTNTKYTWRLYSHLRSRAASRAESPKHVSWNFTNQQFQTNFAAGNLGQGSESNAVNQSRAIDDYTISDNRVLVVIFSLVGVALNFFSPLLIVARRCSGDRNDGQRLRFAVNLWRSARRRMVLKVVIMSN